MARRRVVITGLGNFSPLGIGIKEYWKNLFKRIFPLKKIDLFPTKEFKCKYAFQMGEFDFYKYFKNLRSSYIPRGNKFLLIATKTALEDAGFREYYDKSDIGIFTSSRYGSGDASYEFYRNILLRGPTSVDPMAFPAAIIIYASSYLGLVNRFRGPNITFSTGFHAGLEAINFASNLIKQGDIKIALVSGLNDIYIVGYAHLNSRGLLYKPNRERGYRIGIFDNKRNGYISGENASTLILEDMVEAKRRKAKVYAEVLGYSTNFGQSDDSYVEAIRRAINNSGLAPKDIDLCMLSANGVKSIDLMEINAMKRIFSNNLDKIRCIAIKENNGECEGASSTLQVLVAAKAIHEKLIPPSVYRYGRSNILNGINIEYNPKKMTIKNALINSFNLEGNNATLIISKVN